MVAEGIVDEKRKEKNHKKPKEL